MTVDKKHNTQILSKCAKEVQVCRYTILVQIILEKCVILT